MNGYSNNGFTQSLNGILSLTDGLGTTIENGAITTGNITGSDITGDNITGDTITGATFRGTTVELSGNLTIDQDLNVDGLTNLLNITDASSLLDESTYSLKINGGVIIKQNLYATDEMSNNIVSGNIGCGNLNSSNNITCVDLMCDTINCNSIRFNEISNHYKNKIAGYLNIGIAPYYKIPLITSLYNLDDGDIINFYLSPLLINSNNNTLFLLPYYIVTFYNNENIIFYSDNSSGLYPMLFQNIIFDPSFTCTKILISYKNIII